MLYLIEINAKYVHSNLAMRYFINRLQTNDIGYTHKQLTINQPYQVALSYLLDGVEPIEDPPIFLFSCYIWNIEVVEKFARDIKSVHPAALIFLGGPEVSFHSVAWLDQRPYIDGILAHEGEGFIEALIQSLKKNTDARPYGHETSNDVQAVDCVPVEYELSHFFLPLKGQVTRYQPIEMDGLGIGYTASELGKINIAYYESSRGCPYQCSYCMSSLGSKLRFKSLEVVKKELEQLIESGVSVVKFIDRTFNAPVHRAIEILRIVAQLDKGITTFHFELSPNGLTDDLIQAVASLRQDLVQFELGIQSTNPKTLQAIRRHMPIETLSAVAKLCQLDNCHTHLDLIAGLPFEDFASFEKSVNDVLKLSPDHLQLGMLKLLHGAPLSEEATQYGYGASKHAPYEFLYNQWLTYHQKVRLMAVEEGMERVHNSERLNATLKHIHALLPSPFLFYEAVGQWINQRLIQGYQVSFDQVVEQVIAAAKVMCETGQSHDFENILLELIAFDSWHLDVSFPSMVQGYREPISHVWHVFLRENPDWLCEEHQNLPVKQVIKQLIAIRIEKSVLQLVMPALASEMDVTSVLLIKIKGKPNHTVVDPARHPLFAPVQGD